MVSSHRSGQVGVSHLPTRHRLRPGLSTRPWSAGPGSDRTDGGGRCRSAAGGGGHRRCLEFVGLFWNASKQGGSLLCFYVFSWLLLLSFVFPEFFLETGDDPSEIRGKPSQLGVPPINSEIDMWNSPWSFLRAAMSFLYILQCWRMPLVNLFHHWFHHNDLKWQITWMMISEWSILRNPHVEVTPMPHPFPIPKGFVEYAVPAFWDDVVVYWGGFWPWEYHVRLSYQGFADHGFWVLVSVVFVRYLFFLVQTTPENSSTY